MLSVNISELALTVVSFFLLLFVLDRLLFRPLIRFMDARQAKIDAGLRLGAEADQAVTKAKIDGEKLLEETRRQAEQSAAQANLQEQKRLAEAAKRLSREAELAAAESQARVREQREKNAAELAAMGPQLSELLAQRLLR